MQSNQYINDFNKTVTLLCVEDDENILLIYKELFSIVFKEVYFAQDGEEGLEIFKKESIDIVLTDYMMPKKDGLQMSASIREIDASVPIILVTALESVEVLRKALSLHITSFLSKPFTSHSLFTVFNTAVKNVLADRMTKKEQQKMLEYSIYQENLSFEKEKLIAQNDLSAKDDTFAYNCSVYYKAHDILSGDSYTIRELSGGEYFFSIIDGMGKGISASVSAMLCSAAINFYISDLKKGAKAFVMRDFLEYFFAFIQPNLLDDEVVSATFVLYKVDEEIIEYAIYSMPPILYLDGEEKLNKISSNNPPIGKYGTFMNIDTKKVADVMKVVLYSDGLNENSVDDGAKSYFEYLQDHFYTSKSAEDFQAMVEHAIIDPEDDITYIYLQRKGGKGIA